MVYFLLWILEAQGKQTQHYLGPDWLRRRWSDASYLLRHTSSISWRWWHEWDLLSNIKTELQTWSRLYDISHHRGYCDRNCVRYLLPTILADWALQASWRREALSLLQEHLNHLFYDQRYTDHHIQHYLQQSSTCAYQVGEPSHSKRLRVFSYFQNIVSALS